MDYPGSPPPFPIPERVGGDSGGRDSVKSQFLSVDSCDSSAKRLVAPPMKRRATNRIAIIFLCISSPLLYLEAYFKNLCLRFELSEIFGFFVFNSVLDFHQITALLTSIYIKTNQDNLTLSPFFQFLKDRNGSSMDVYYLGHLI